MTDTIKQYEQELWAEYVELRDAFGALDDAVAEESFASNCV